MINYYFDSTDELKPYAFQAEATENTMPPDNATRIKPEFKKGFIPCFIEGSWVLKANNKDKKAYSTKTKEQVNIDYYGDLKEDYTFLVPPEPVQFANWCDETKTWIVDEEAKATYEQEQTRLNMKPLSRFQAMTVLKLTKVGDTTLYKATVQYIESLGDKTIEEITFKTAWGNAVEFRRDSAMIKTMQSKFGLTNEQVDDMFTQGAEIVA